MIIISAINPFIIRLILSWGFVDKDLFDFIICTVSFNVYSNTYYVLITVCDHTHTDESERSYREMLWHLNFIKIVTARQH